MLEDLSTNGTYVNGEMVGKGQRREVDHHDEISFGRKFNGKKETPEVIDFVGMKYLILYELFGSIFNEVLVTIFFHSDWAFQGKVIDSEHIGCIDIIKRGVVSFSDLLCMGESHLEDIGVWAGPIRQVIMSALSVWRHERRFPIFILDLDCFEESLSAKDTSSSASRGAAIAESNLRCNSTDSTGNSRNPVIAASAQGVSNQLNKIWDLPPLSNTDQKAPKDLPLPFSNSDDPAIMEDLISKFPCLDVDTIKIVVKYEALARESDPSWFSRIIHKLKDLESRQEGSQNHGHSEVRSLFTAHGPPPVGYFHGLPHPWIPPSAHSSISTDGQIIASYPHCMYAYSNGPYTNPNDMQRFFPGQLNCSYTPYATPNHQIPLSDPLHSSHSQIGAVPQSIFAQSINAMHPDYRTVPPDGTLKATTSQPTNPRL
jgi:hypothetical protein